MMRTRKTLVLLVTLAVVGLPPAVVGQASEEMGKGLWARVEALPQATGESNWSNLQQLPLGARLLIERTDGTRVKGGLISIADDALGVRKGKVVVGVARPEVGRIWLLGKSKARKGALRGAVVGGVAGAVLGAALFRGSYESGENYGVLFGLVLGGAGAGVGAGAGAGVGAGFRERALIYRAPPPGEPSTAASHTAPCEAPANRAPCAHPLSAPGPLPAVLEEVSRPFNAERAILKLAQETNPR